MNLRVDVGEGGRRRAKEGGREGGRGSLFPPRDTTEIHREFKSRIHRIYSTRCKCRVRKSCPSRGEWTAFAGSQDPGFGMMDIFVLGMRPFLEYSPIFY